MAISRITSPEAPEPVDGMWSNCLVHDGRAYLSGLTARNANLVNIDGIDEYEQTRLILEKHKALVEAAGGSMSDVVKLTIYVTNIANREMVWKARREFFSGNFPACSLVEVSSLAPGVLVEIEGIAHIGASAS